MRDDLLSQFGASELPRYVTALLERAHAVARGSEVAIRVARMCAVQEELAGSPSFSNADADQLLALAQASSELLADRIEALADSKHRGD